MRQYYIRLSVLVAGMACIAPAADGVWQGVNAQWSNPANWEDGAVPGDGGTAVFKTGTGVVTSFSNDVAGLTLGGLVFSNNVTWTMNPGEPINFSADTGATNVIHVNENYVNVRSAFGTGACTLMKTGDGYLNVTNTVSGLSGRWLIASNRVEIKTGTSLVSEPVSYQPDAIILDGGAIKNNDSSPVFPATMGITLGPRGGSFVIGWQSHYTMTYASPITGPGALLISRNNGRHLLQNPANDYAGGTVVGTNAPGYHPANTAYLQLDADGVLPYGTGKGGLTVEGRYHGIVDLAGHSNRVSALAVTGGGILTNRVPGAGALYADGLDLQGRLEADTRVVWCGGPFHLQMADGSGSGTVEVPSGSVLALTGPQALGGVGLLLNGSTVSRSTSVGVEASVATNSGLLLVGAEGGALVATGSEPYPPLVLRGGVVEDDDNTTNAVLSCNTDLIIDGPAGMPAVYDAEVSVPGGSHVVFRGSVWIARLPAAGTWQAAAGADVYLIGDAVSELATFTNEACRIRIVEANQADFGPEVGVGAGGEVWYDTLALSDGDLVDAVGNVLNVAHDVTLAGGTLGFDGLGTITHGGAIGGSGELVKDDLGTTVLNGANSFAGSVTVNGGTLVAGSGAALGASGNTVTLDGGYLANAADADLTLLQDVTLVSGGFIVNGGSIRLSGGLTLVDGTLDKQGNGELIIEAAALSASAGLNLTGGAVVLEVAAGTTNKLVLLTGTGDLVKRGEGVLVVQPDSGYAGKIVLEEGVLLDELKPATGPSFWLDASAAASLAFEEGSATNIIAWRDVRDTEPALTNYPYAWLNAFSPNLGTTGYKTAIPPVLMQNQLLSLPAVDFGIYESGSWLEFVAVSNARTFFWVIGSQNGGGFLIGSPNKACARGGDVSDGTLIASDPLWGGWIASELLTSQNWLDGTSVPGTSTGLSGGFDLLSTVASGPVTVNGLAKDMRTTLTGGHADFAKRSGGQRLAELLIYERVLTDAERTDTENYLRRKWFGDTGGGGRWSTELQVTGSGTLMLPQEGVAVAFDRLTGGGTLTKAGGGTLTVEAPESFGGTLALAEGAFTADGMLAALTADAAPTNPVPGAAFWVDASAADTFGTDGGGRAYWRDVRWTEGGDYLVATQRWSYAPVILSNAVGTLPVIDMGPTNNATVEKGMQWSQNLTNVRTVFLLIGSQNGGGILLGGNDDTTSDFNRGPVASAATPLYYQYTSANVKNGLTRIDAVPVDGTVTGLSGGYQVIAMRTAGNVFAGQFAHDRYLTARGGGQRLGEVIVYTNVLSDADMAAVEAYLLDKWQRPGTRGQSATLLHLDAPAEGASPAAGVLSVGVRNLKVEQLSGTGVLQKAGSATLTVSRYGDFSGELTVAGGSAAFVGRSAFRYVRLTVGAIRGGGTVENPLRTSLGELELLKNGVKVPWPSGTVATGSTCLTGYGPDKLKDGLLNAAGRWITISGLPAWAQFDLLAATEFDAYRLITGSETNYHYRDPTAWTFEVSNDGSTWVPLDSKTAQSYPSSNSYVLGPYALAGEGGGGEISGMTLMLEAGASAAFAPGSHTLGALGGIGSVTADDLTVAGLNLVSSLNGSDVLALAAALTVEDDAAWNVSVTSGDVVPVEASDDIAFVGGGSLSVTGAAGLADGAHLLAAAVGGASLTGFNVSAWTVTSDDSTRQFNLYSEGEAVYLRVSGKGLLLMLR